MPSQWPNSMTLGDVVRLTFNVQVITEPCQISFDLALKQAETNTDTFVTRVEGFIKSLILSALTAECVIQNMTLSDLFPGTNPGRLVARTGDTGANTGTLVTSGVCQDPANAAVVRLKTYLRGQHNRGRIFWPGVPVGAELAGELTTTYQGDVTSTTGGIKTTLNGTFGVPTGADHPTWGIWRHVLSRVPAANFSGSPLDAVNPIVGRVNFKPVYQFPPGNKTLPLTANAFIAIVDASTIDPIIREQRRREKGRRISRAHRVPRTAP